MLNITGDQNPPQYATLNNSDGQVKLPDEVDLQSANFARDGSDLLINTDSGAHFVVPGYFSEETLSDLIGHNGHAFSGDFFDTQSDINAENQYAQVKIPGLEVTELNPTTAQAIGEPIGTVDNVEGVASVTHVDGTTEFLEVGDKVYQGDILVTETGAGVGITLADTSVFSLGEEGELILDELVYDPGQEDGQAVLSLVEGTASFVSGQIAKINPDAFSITTPVATIGIRGTKVFIEYKDGEFKAVNLIETTLDGDQAGEIVIFDLNGNPIGTTNEANIGWSWNPSKGETPSSQRFSETQVETMTRGAVRNLPRSLAEEAREAQEIEEALKEAADVAKDEAIAAQEEALSAEQEAELAKEAALKAQAEAEALLAQAELLQQEELALQAAEAQRLAELEMQAALEAENIALDALAEAERALQAERLAQEAAQQAREDALSAYTKATQYTGYGVNTEQQKKEEEEGATQLASNTQNNDPDVELNSAEDDGSSFINTFNPDTNSGSSQNNDPQPSSEEPEEETSQTPDTQQDQNQNNTQQAQNISGTAVDGYLDGATVFIDLNGNGIVDAGEDSAITSNGSFVLNTIHTSHEITITGGTDIATGLEFYGALKAPAGSTVITPLTTVLASLMETGQTQAEATQTLASAFGFDANIDLTGTDPIAGAAEGNTDLAEIAAIGVQLQNTIIQAAAVIEGASGGDLGDASTSDSVFAAIAETIKSQTTFDANGIPQTSSFDINATGSLSPIITEAAKETFGEGTSAATNAINAASDTATLISNSNTVIKNYITDVKNGDVVLGNDGGTSFLTSISQVAKVANDAVTQLESIDFTSDTTSAFSSLNASFSADQLDSRIASAEVNDVNGDGTVNLKPVLLSGTEDITLTFSNADLLLNQKGFEEGASLTVSNVKTQSGDPLSFYDGMWVYTPESNSTSDVTFTYEISDGTTTIATSAVASFTAVNDDPTVNTVSLANGVENEAYTITGEQLLANASDIDGDNLTVTDVVAIGQDEDFSIVKTRDEEIWTITSGSTGSKTLIFTVSDGTTTVNQTVTLTFEADLDNALNNDGITLDEDNSGTIINVLANDSILDGNAGITITTPSHGVAVLNQDNTITYTPTADYSGSDSFTYTVTDDDGETETATVNLTITAINDAPSVTYPVTLSETENTPVTITVEQLLNGATDADGDNLNIEDFTLISGEGDLSANGDESDGGITSWTYEPDAQDDNGVSFSYEISDGTTTTSQTATVSFIDVDNTLSDDTGTVNEDGSVTLSVLDNDTIVDGATVSANTAPSHGSVVYNNDNTITYTPTADYNGSDSFTYTVTDEGGETATATVSLTVAAINDAPVAGSAISLNATAEDTPITITATQLLNGASDVDGDSLSISDFVIQSGNGDLTPIPDENYETTIGWVYTPDEHDDTAVTFSYNITDGSLSDSTTATLDITPVNDAPVAGTPVTFTTPEDTNITITEAQLLSGATDQENDGLSIENLTIQSGNGTLTQDQNDDGSISWTYEPKTDDDTDVTFSYNITDGNLSDSTTASLSIIADADVPSLSMSLGAGSEATVQGQTTTITIDETNLTETNNGFAVTGVAQQNQTASVDNLVIHNEPGDPLGFGISGTQSGNQDEIGYTSFAEILYVDFDTAVSSVSVAFAWLSNAETVAYEFFLNGSSVGTGTQLGDTDNIDDAVSLSPDGGTFDQIIFKPNNKGDDFLINEITFEQTTADASYVDIPIYLSASQTDSDGSETLSSITLSGIPDTATLYAGETEITVSNGSATLANDNLDDVKIRVTEDQDNFDLTASITSTDGNDSETTTQKVNVPDYTFNESGNDVIAIQSGNVTIDGGSGSDTLQVEAGFDPNFATDNLTLTSIETFDLLTDTTANTVTIGASDIVSMTDSNNSLMIEGDSLDTLTFSDASGWSAGEGGEGYTTYSYNQDNTTAQVTVNSNVNVTGF